MSGSVIDSRFEEVLSSERGTRSFQERDAARRFGPNHRAVRRLLSEAARVEAFPGYVNDSGRWEKGLRVEASDFAWEAGFGWHFADELDAAAESALEGAKRSALPALRDALLAAATAHLLPESVHDGLMSRWWRALDDPRWLNARED